MDPAASLASYDVGQAVGPGLQFIDRSRYIDPLLAAVDSILDKIPDLSDEQIADLIAFLDTLTDPAATDLAHLTPDRVPSGLPVDR